MPEPTPLPLPQTDTATGTTTVSVHFPTGKVPGTQLLGEPVWKCVDCGYEDSSRSLICPNCAEDGELMREEQEEPPCISCKGAQGFTEDTSEMVDGKWVTRMGWRQCTTCNGTGVQPR